MSCLPGMPCYNSPVVKIVYPPGCDPTPVPVISSDQVHYDGPNLPCTGVQNGDCLNVALEKIDTKICSEELVASIIQTIENNDVLKAYFCQLVSSCIPTTTTSTTQVIGTAYSVISASTPQEVCDGLGSPLTIYTLPSDTIEDGVQAFTDINCTTPYINSAFAYLNIVYSTNGSGTISFVSIGCGPFTTTTTSSSSTSTSTSTSSSTTTTTTTVAAFELFVAIGPSAEDACAAFPASVVYCSSMSINGQIVYTNNTLTTPAANISFAYSGEYFTTDETGLATFVSACV